MADRNDRQQSYQGGRGRNSDWGNDRGPRFDQNQSSDYDQQSGGRDDYGQRSQFDQNRRHGDEFNRFGNVSSDPIGSRGGYSNYQGGYSDYRGDYAGAGSGGYGRGASGGFREEQYHRGGMGEGYLTPGSTGGWHHEQGQGTSHRGRGPSNYQRSDDRIREDVNDRLTDDHDVDASDIQVSVSQGEVTLAGEVDSRQAKRRAEDCADDVSGVKHVQNNLRVKAQRDHGTTSSAAGKGEST